LQVVTKNNTPQVKSNSTGLVIYLPLALLWKQEEEEVQPFKDEKQSVSFKDPVRTEQ
jgi:hypothetical protein